MKEEVILKKKKSKRGAVPVVGFSLVLAPAIVTFSNIENVPYFRLQKTLDGEYVTIGIISYENLKECYFVNINNYNLNIDEFYICEKVNKNNGFVYRDIISNKEVFECFEFDAVPIKNGKKVVNEFLLSDYLCNYNYVKSEYTFDEVENLLEKIKNDEKSEEKTLVKTTFNSSAATKVGTV